MFSNNFQKLQWYLQIDGNGVYSVMRVCVGKEDRLMQEGKAANGHLSTWDTIALLHSNN